VLIQITIGMRDDSWCSAVLATLRRSGFIPRGRMDQSTAWGGTLPRSVAKSETVLLAGPGLRLFLARVIFSIRCHQSGCTYPTSVSYTEELLPRGETRSRTQEKPCCVLWIKCACGGENFLKMPRHHGGSNLSLTNKLSQQGWVRERYNSLNGPILRRPFG
jgi:hypothetical protein